MSGGVTLSLQRSAGPGRPSSHQEDNKEAPSPYAQETRSPIHSAAHNIGWEVGGKNWSRTMASDWEVQILIVAAANSPSAHWTSWFHEVNPERTPSGPRLHLQIRSRKKMNRSGDSLPESVELDQCSVTRTEPALFPLNPLFD